MGHELSHALDDRGQAYDAGAMPRPWWTPPDLQRFRESARIVADQYDAYRPLRGVRVNGDFTLTENLADVTGVSLAYRGYLLSLKGQPAPVLDGFTGPQRFFMGWAAMWRSKVRDGYMRQWLLTLPHAPYEYRANGPVSHLPGFYEAFGVTASDRLFRSPATRVRMW